MQPQAYNRATDFTDRTGDDTDNSAINQELDAAAISINEIRDNLELIQRDDGQLVNGIVTADALDNSAFDAVQASVNAATAAAQSSADSANNAALSANTARDAAIAAKVSAETARDASGLNATNSAASALASFDSATASEASKVASVNAKIAAQAAQTASELAALNSSGSADSANASKGLAQDWAIKTPGAVAGGEYSAKKHAQDAASSATSANASAAIAATKAAEATTKAGEASTSAAAAAAASAAAASALDSFDDRYLGAKSSAPSVDNDGNALLAGALYYNTTTGKMNVYDGGVWIEASAASQAILTVYKFTATAGQTTFSGTDDASLTLGYTVGSAIFTLNGVVLEVGSEVTATSGTSAVLASAASAGDEFNVYAFATFNLANVYTKNESDVGFVAVTGNQSIAGNKNFAGNTLYVDDTNDRVGIGTATPDNKLLVAGSLGVLDDNLQLRRTGQTTWNITNFASNLYFNNGSDRMIIDAGGRITMPYQPAFLASFSSVGTISIPANTKIGFNSTKFNRGSHFSTANQRFTAPVTGVYKFTASFHCNNTTQNRPVFRVNGGDYTVTADAAQSILQTGAGGDISLVIDILMELNANDFVEIANRGGGTTNMSFYSGHSWWSGYLVG